MSTLTLQAPAKLNLSLRVLGKRNDGFHEIDTLMVKIPGLHDLIVISPAKSFAFECDDTTLPADQDNLVVKAVRAYEKAAGITCNYTLSLNKTIPHGAGLGGGSSDAATTLLGLDQLHDGKLGPARLLKLATTLGSDIPFFLTSGSARCTGRGETLKSASAPQLRILIVKPPFAVSTPDAYKRWSTSSELPGISYAPQESGGISLVNDLERPVFGKHLFLAELKEWLLDRRETTAAQLCGSGSAMFAVLHEDADPEELARCARHELDPGIWHWAGITGA